jgi:hypothetical protein
MHLEIITAPWPETKVKGADLGQQAQGDEGGCLHENVGGLKAETAVPLLPTQQPPEYGQHAFYRKAVRALQRCLPCILNLWECNHCNFSHPVKWNTWGAPKEDTLLKKRWYK